MDTPEEKAAFDDGKDYVVHELQEWIKKKRREIGIECARYAKRTTLLRVLISKQRCTPESSGIT